MARRLRESLGDELVGVYLTGSAAAGDWAPGRSDIDVIVVCSQRLSSERKRRLAEPLRHRWLPCPARGLELVVYRREVVRAPRRPLDFELNLNTGPGMKERLSLDPAGEPGHWFVIDLAAAPSRAQTLAGPPAVAVIGATPRSDLLAALGDSLVWHADHEGASANTVLNACRAWRYALTGAWSTKKQAATWALERGGHTEAIQAAVAAHAGRPGDLNAPAVERLLAQVRRAIRIAA